MLARPNTVMKTDAKGCTSSEHTSRGPLASAGKGEEHDQNITDVVAQHAHAH